MTSDEKPWPLALVLSPKGSLVQGFDIWPEDDLWLLNSEHVLYLQKFTSIKFHV